MTPTDDGGQQDRGTGGRLARLRFRPQSGLAIAIIRSRGTRKTSSSRIAEPSRPPREPPHMVCIAQQTAGPSGAHWQSVDHNPRKSRRCRPRAGAARRRSAPAFRLSFGEVPDRDRRGARHLHRPVRRARECARCASARLASDQ